MFASTHRFDLGTVLVSQKALQAIDCTKKSRGLDVILRRQQNLVCGEMSVDWLIDRLMALKESRQVISEFTWKLPGSSVRTDVFVVTTDAGRTTTTVMLAHEVADQIDDSLPS